MKPSRSSARHVCSLTLAGVALLSFSACSDDDAPMPAATGPGAGGEGQGAGAGGTDPGTALSSGEAPTFFGDVAPIFAAKCTSCHQEGGIAPFVLNDYEAARERGGQIADYTENRIMPPYSMQTGGECGTFDESRALTTDEIAIIGAWGRGERAEGTPADLPALPLPMLEGATELTLPEFTPVVDGSAVALFDEYRCFLVEPELDALSFITGYDVVPGNSAIVHHVLGFIVDPELVTEDGRSNAEVMQALDDEGPNPERPGWSCFGAAGEGVDVEAVPVTWAPGQGVVSYKGGIGVPVLPGRKLVMQVHYNLADSATVGQSDQTRVRMQIQPVVERPAAFLLPDPFLDSLFEGTPTELEAGQPSVKYVWERTGAEMGIPPGVQADLMSIFPHMHERGRKYTFEVDNGDGYQCQGQIDRWDFNWQRFYDYVAPLPFTADTRVRVTCDFDTSAVTEPVLPGWGTRNEMCLATLMLALPGGQ
jgi:hypothetical protein